MITEFQTIICPGEDEIIEKKSRFIGYARPVETEEEAIAFIESIKKQHYDARHNCFAYSIGIGQPILRFSDDGEPQGTAGKPMLEIITGKNLTNICLVVTRYFGGTLLGTGGLLRAYQEASNLAVQNAGIVKKQLMKHLLVETDYVGLGKLTYLFSNDDECENGPVNYTDKVLMEVFVTAEHVNKLSHDIIELTNGKAIISELSEEFQVRKV